MSDLTPYEQLHHLAELELEHAGRGELDELSAVQEARERLVATLPATPPPEARLLLERTIAVHERTTIDLLRGREQILLSLASVRQGQRAAAGYAASVGPRVRREQLA